MRSSTSFATSSTIDSARADHPGLDADVLVGVLDDLGERTQRVLGHAVPAYSAD
jgi:hypothetical protein